MPSCVLPALLCQALEMAREQVGEMAGEMAGEMEMKGVPRAVAW